MHKFHLLLLLVVAVPSLVVGQNEEKKYEVFGGYSFLTTDVQESGTPIDRFNGLDGVNAAVTRYFTKRFGITGDFSAHFRNDTQNITGGTVRFKSRSFSYMAGPHFSFKNRSRFTPFVHALAGASNNRFSYRATATGATTPAADVKTTVTDFVLALGGGLDVRVSKRVGLRLFQIDYNPVFVRARPEFGDGLRFDNVRFSIGIVFK